MRCTLAVALLSVCIGMRLPIAVDRRGALLGAAAACCPFYAPACHADEIEVAADIETRALKYKLKTDLAKERARSGVLVDPKKLQNCETLGQLAAIDNKAKSELKNEVKKLAQEGSLADENAKLLAEYRASIEKLSDQTVKLTAEKERRVVCRQENDNLLVTERMAAS